jgi:hypothetical protein
MVTKLVAESGGFGRWCVLLLHASVTAALLSPLSMHLACTSVRRLPSSIAFMKCAPVRVKISSEPANLAHPVEAVLTKLVPSTRSPTSPMPPWILFPVWVRLASFISWTSLPIGVGRPSQPLVFEDTREITSVAVKVSQPIAVFLLCFGVAPRTQLPSMSHSTTGS